MGRLMADYDLVESEPDTIPILEIHPDTQSTGSLGAITGREVP